jgi:hypothetical protein
MLESLLALQQVDEAVERDRAARRHGRTLLGALGRLQHLLLAADGAALAQPAVLAELRSLAGSLPAAADPGLAASLDLVVLRARIELIRHGG